MEGLEPSAEALPVFQRYIEGDLSLKEMGRAVDQLLDREYGLVRLSRNERSQEPSGYPRRQPVQWVRGNSNHAVECGTGT
jgi:hypothetical protein